MGAGSSSRLNKLSYDDLACLYNMAIYWKHDPTADFGDFRPKSRAGCQLAERLRTASPEVVGSVAARAAGILRRRGAERHNKVARRYPGMLRPTDQHRLLAGDLVITNFQGLAVLKDFRHAAVVVQASRLEGEELIAEVAGCRLHGCCVESLQFPVDATTGPVGRRDMDRHQRRGLSAGNCVFVVRYVGPGRERLVASVVEIARRWAGRGAAPLTYEFNTMSLLRPKACLGSADTKRARRYGRAAVDGPTPEVVGMICSEFAVAVWLAAIALDVGEGDLKWVLDRLLPVRDARGCWPRNVWQLGERPYWRQVGVVCDVSTFTEQGLPAGYD